MPDTIRQRIIFDAAYGSITGGDEFRRQVADTYGRGVGEGTVQGVKGASAKLRSEFKETLKAATTAGMRKPMRALAEDWKRTNDKIVAQQEQLLAKQTQFRNTTNAQEKEKLRGEIDKSKALIAAEEKALRDRVKKLKGSAEYFGEMIEASTRRAGRNWQESVSKGAEKLDGVISQALSADNLDAAGIANVFSGALGRAGEFSASVGAKYGGQAGRMGQLGAAATSLAGAAAALAGVAAGFAAVLALLGAAYAQTKDLNKSLLDGAAAADMFSDRLSVGAGDLADKLGSLRQAAIGLSFSFRMGKDEATDLLKSLMDSGLTLNQWGKFVRGTGTDLEKFTQVAEAAAKYTLAFGISADEFGSYANTMFRDFGNNLDTLEDGLTSIFMGAQKANISTKAFFTAVNEATSGMALYNFRLEDTVGLLTNMIEILGEDLAKAQMSGGLFDLSGMGQEERTRFVMNAGGTAAVRGDLQADLRSQLDTFNETFGDLTTNLDSTLLENGRLSADAFANMSEDAFGDMIYELRQGEDAQLTAMARNLENLRGLARGAREGGGLGAVATGVGYTSQSGALALRLREARSLSGTGPLGELEGLSQQAYESLTGRSGEELEVLKRLDRQLRAQFRAETGQQITSGNFDEFTKWVSSGKASEMFDSEVAVEQYKAMTMMERLAQDQVKETRSMSAILSGTIALTLEKINGAMEGVLSLMGGGGRDRADLLQDINDSMTSNAEALEEAQAELSTLKDELARTTDSAEVAQKRAEIELKERELAGLMETSGSLQRQYRAAATGGVENADDMLAMELKEQFGVGRRSDVIDKLMEDLTDDQLKAMEEALGSEIGVSTRPQDELEDIRKIHDYLREENIPLDPAARRDQQALERQRELAEVGVITDLSAPGGQAPVTARKLIDVLGTDPYTSPAFTEASDFDDLTQMVGGDRLDRYEGSAQVSGFGHAYLTNDMIAAIQEGNEEELNKLLAADQALEGSMNQFGLDLTSDTEGLPAIVSEAKDIETAVRDLPRMMQIADLAGQLGMDAGVVGSRLRTRRGQTDLIRRINELEGNEAAIALGKALGVQGQYTPREKPELGDFIYRGDGMGGTLTPISSRDQFLGLYEGSPIARGLNRTGGGSGNVVININGGDEQVVYRTVKKALQARGRR
jgi:hypothetical protein